jgi:predicted RNA binding protein YcfA (HicA-like mRNA interferase family)
MRKVSDRVYVAIVPDHREIAPGTLRSILRQAGLTRGEFLSLLEK